MLSLFHLVYLSCLLSYTSGNFNSDHRNIQEQQCSLVRPVAICRPSISDSCAFLLANRWSPSVIPASCSESSLRPSCWASITSLASVPWQVLIKNHGSSCRSILLQVTPHSADSPPSFRISSGCLFCSYTSASESIVTYFGKKTPNVGAHGALPLVGRSVSAAGWMEWRMRFASMCVHACMSACSCGNHFLPYLRARACADSCSALGIPKPLSRWAKMFEETSPKAKSMHPKDCMQTNLEAAQHNPLCLQSAGQETLPSYFLHPWHAKSHEQHPTTMQRQVSVERDCFWNSHSWMANLPERSPAGSTHQHRSCPSWKKASWNVRDQPQEYSNCNNPWSLLVRPQLLQLWSAVAWYLRSDQCLHWGISKRTWASDANRRSRTVTSPTQCL